MGGFRKFLDVFLQHVIILGFVKRSSGIYHQLITVGK